MRNLHALMQKYNNRLGVQRVNPFYPDFQAQINWNEEI